MNVRALGPTLLGVLSLAGCSLLVQPNEARLRPDGAGPADATREAGGDDVIEPPMDVLAPPEDGMTAPPDAIEPPTDAAGPDAAGPDASACSSGCDDGIACTDDRCNEALGRCEFTPNPASCGTGLVCNPAMGGCVAVPCTGNGMCDDGNACNGNETCSMGRCIPGTPLVCGDGDACNGFESCDPRMGCQRGTPLMCDDGLFCNGTETCERARGCVPGTPPVCNDGVACTTDTCVESRRRCESVPDSARCAMGQVCNATMGCVTTGCTGNAMCDDGNACNGAETCVMGACRPGTALRCDDGNLCNGVESCDGRMGCVAGTALRCDDGRFCNGAETCDPARGCLPGTAPMCRDGNVCTVDACNPMADMGRGACVNTPVDADGDGFPAAAVSGTACAGGRDCNDADRAINPGAMEVCNLRDDNCNGMIDEGLSCTMAPANDQCAGAQAIALSATMTSVTVTGTTVNATHQIGSRCGGDGQPDVYYQITYPGTADLVLEANGTGTMDPVLQYAGQSCASAVSTTFACNDDVAAGARAARMWVRAVPGVLGARTVVIAVDSFDGAGVGAFTLTASLAMSVTPGGCGTRFDLSRGGTVYGIAPAQIGSLSGSCSPGGYMSLGEQGFVYSGASRGARITGAATGFRPMLTVRDLMNCSNERACSVTGGNSATITTSQTSGTIVIDGIPNGPAGSNYQYAVEFVPQ
jgi:hypothetical protein